MILIILWIVFYLSWWVTILYCGYRADWGLYTRICAYFLLPFYFFVYFSWFFEGQWYLPLSNPELTTPFGGIV